MKADRYDGSVERRVVAGMVTDAALLAVVATNWTREGLLSSSWANAVGSMCVAYFNKYGKAPGRAVGPMMEEWCAKRKGDSASTSLMEDFLDTVSDEHARRRKESSEFLIDAAERHFNEVALTRLSDQIAGAVGAGKLDEALALADSFKKVEVAATSGVSVFSDREAVKRAFSHSSEVLVTYPGSLGEFFGDSLERDGFISFEGPEKRGKSWLLQDVAFRAVLQKRRVLYFDSGDMSQSQVMRRFMTRVSHTPRKAGPYRVPKEVTRPAVAGDAPAVEYEERRCVKPLSWGRAWRACEDLCKRLKVDDSLQLYCFPNSTLTVKAIKAEVESRERKGWVADVVVIDYADILAPPPGHKESRDQVNAIWKELRALSQTFHCLVVTATQTDAASYTTHTLSMRNFSEDKRKRAHVTGAVGINQTDEEKDLEVIRLNWIVRRERPFSPRKCVYVAGCRAVAAPCMKSSW